MRFFEFKNEEAAGVGIVTKQNATADVPVGGEYMNVKKLFPKKKKKKESIEEAFVEPNFDYEWEEANRYPEFQKIGKEKWIELAKKGEVVTITSATGIRNTDATEPDSFSSLDKDKQARALAQLDSGNIEMPIVAVYSDGHKELIGGNTRLTALMAKKIPAMVWQFEVPDDIATTAHTVANLAVNKKESMAYEDMFQGLNSKSEIYVDMDGVLADFFGEWKKLVGKDWREIDKDEIEPALKKIRDEEDFWLNIPLTANAKKLLSIIKQVKGNYKILSSPLANDPKSEPHKREWIEKNLDFFPPTEVIITKDKAKYATNPDGTPNILIDDYGVNIAAWESAGGIGFKHKDHKFERTAKKLKAEIEESFQHLMREFIAEGWSEKYKKSINCSNPKGFSQKAHCAGRKKK
jgi:5'(3')-deoxyribonucleotidase